MAKKPEPAKSEVQERHADPRAIRAPARLAARQPIRVRAPDLENDRYPNERSSVGKRAFISLLVIFCIGVSATLALQWYGDKEMSASSYPQLSGLAPQAEPVPQNSPDVIGLTSRTASSLDRQEPNPISLDLGAVQQSINQIATSIASSQGHTDRMTATQEQMARSLDRLATAQEQMARTIDRMAASQEQMTRSLDHLTADQEQMTREITKLHEIEQSIRLKNSQPSPRSLSATAPKPISRPAFASTPKPMSPTPTLPEPTIP